MQTDSHLRVRVESVLTGPIFETVQEAPGQTLTAREAKLQEQMICLLVANGESEIAVATKLGITPQAVRRTIANPRGMEMVVRFQHDIAPEPRQRLKKMASIALDVQSRILLGNGPEGIKARVANEVLDRSEGKATQVIESRSMTFDLKDALAIDKALKASQEKLARIEDMQKKLALPVGQLETVTN